MSKFEYMTEERVKKFFNLLNASEGKKHKTEEEGYDILKAWNDLDFPQKKNIFLYSLDTNKKSLSNYIKNLIIADYFEFDSEKYKEYSIKTAENIH